MPPQPADAAAEPSAYPHIHEALAALRIEAHDAARTVVATAYAAEPVADGIYAMDVGGIDIEPGWEGARVLRPRVLNSELTPDDDEPNRELLWSATVVTVDDVACQLFVIMDPNSREPAPTTGDFLLTPFDFLTQLVAVLTRQARHDPADLQARLAHSLGDTQPRSCVADPIDDSLGSWWQHERPLLWGPPGTGKTHTLARLIAKTSALPDERVLVVSTTNKATDDIALRIAMFAAKLNGPRKTIRRLGAGADAVRFHDAGAMHLLRGGETSALIALSRLRRQMPAVTNPIERAAMKAQQQQLRIAVGEASGLFVNRRVDVVIATTWRAVSALASTELTERLRDEGPPFSTVIVDEAGLVSRPQTAALSLLASQRFVLAGDPMQLAPISRAARVMPAEHQRWLAASGLSHLDEAPDRGDVTLLTEQHRMAPQIRAAVGAYQYRKQLTDADGVPERTARFPIDEPLSDVQRALWWVLDEESPDPTHVRPQRSEAHRSWQRPLVKQCLRRFFQAHPHAAQAGGLFVTPFVGQARHVQAWFGQQGMIDKGWTASTVHRQQGAEADYVLVDTVNAGSTGFSHPDWQRLLNVAVSRARELVILIASRHEAQQPYLQPLLAMLAPVSLVHRGGKWTWRPVDVEVTHSPSAQVRASNPSSLGAQLQTRKAMRAVMSAEQQRLCRIAMDGGPRLVRGVAGSGKTLVLANWVAQTCARNSTGRILVVYGNRSLEGLLARHLAATTTAEQRRKQVSIHHIKDLLTGLLRRQSMDWEGTEWDYGGMAKKLLDVPVAERLTGAYEAVFIDEAQDLGEHALRVVTELARQTNPNDSNARQVVIFYDNAQDIYGRGTPRWSGYGLDLRGRSTVMKESFRSTRPITELALNVLHALDPLERDRDIRELSTMGLLERRERDGQRWWHVRFNHTHGPLPGATWHRHRQAELRSLVHRVVGWIDDGVKPGDIAVLVNKKMVGEQFVALARDALAAVGARALFQSGGHLELAEDLLTVSTIHSFKGYDAEVVALPCVESYCSQGRPLPRNLYVGATRARSILHLSGSEQFADKAGLAVLEAVKETLERQLAADDRAAGHCELGRFADVLRQLGGQHRDWLQQVWNAHRVETDAITSNHGDIIAQPLFWFRDGLFGCACFGPREPTRTELAALRGKGFEVVRPGDDVQ